MATKQPAIPVAPVVVAPPSDASAEATRLEQIAALRAKASRSEQDNDLLLELVADEILGVPPASTAGTPPTG